MMYTEKVMARFRNPQHVGEIPGASGRGKVGNPVCGDLMEIFIKVGKRDGVEVLDDVKVKTFGCVAAISSSDVLCEIAKGLPLSEAEKLTNQDVLKALGEVPQQKKHCSVLAATALHNAIADYRKRAL